MTHRVRQCLIQLCGLHGAIFVNEEATISHISGVMKGLLTLINKYAHTLIRSMIALSMNILP